MNGDEAMCFGAAFIAANSSSQFKVRKVYLTQRPSYDIRIEIRPLEAETGEAVQSSEEGEEGIKYDKDVTLYKQASDFLGQRKTISLTYDKGMKIDAFAVMHAVEEDIEPAEFPLQTFRLPELDTIATNEVATKEGSTKPKVSLQFELSRSHFLKLNKVSAAIDETTLEEIVPEKKEEKKSEESTETSETNDGDAAAEKTEGEAEAEQQNDEAAAAEGEKTEEEEAAPAEPQYKEVIVPHSYPVEVLEELHDVRVLNKDQLKESNKRIKALEKRDEDKMKTDEAKNDYESLIYEFRGWLNEDENAAYISEEDREKFIEKCNAAEDWLYEDGAEAGYKEYQTKTYDLQSDYSVYKKRRTAHQERETEVTEMYTVLNESRDKIAEIQEKKPWITDEEKQDVLDKIQETKEWLDKKMEKQSSKKLDEEPAFEVSEARTKLKSVGKLFKKITEKKKPKEKKPKKVETEDSEEGSSSSEKAESDAEGGSKEQQHEESGRGAQGEEDL